MFAPSTHGEWLRPSAWSRSKVTANVSASRRVRTIRSRLLLASGPSRARSSTSHTGSSPGSLTALCTSPFHCGYVDRSSINSNSSSAAHGASSDAVMSIAASWSDGGGLGRRMLSPTGATGLEQTIEIVGLIERRLPRQHLGVDGDTGIVVGVDFVIGVDFVVDELVDGHVGAELQLFCVVAMTTRLSPPSRGSRRGLRRGLEQPWDRVAAIVEHPTERHHHRIGVPAAQHTRSIGRNPVIGIDPHHQVLGVEAIRHLGDLRTSRAFTQSRHPP